MLPSRLIERLEHWIRHTPERFAHTVGERQTTYRELGERADAVAAHVTRTLPNDGSPIAIIGHKEPEMLAGFVGCLRTGHPYVPIDHAAPMARRDAIVDAASATLTLGVDQIATLPAAGTPTVVVDYGTDRPIYILFTSGSTGVPKGVMLSEDNLVGFLAWIGTQLGLPDEGGVFLNQASFGFDLSVPDLYLALTRGGTVASLTSDDIVAPGRLMPALARSGATTMFVTPSFGGMCLADRAFGATVMPQLRTVVFCGETLPPLTALGFTERFPDARVWTSWGPTEATVMVTALHLDRDSIDTASALPIGRPMPGLALSVRDENGHAVPEGEEGELVISGQSVSAGYFARPDLTARSFAHIDGVWSYRTGDLGRVEAGMYHFHGRRDAQIKFQGYRIELGDIESNLLSVGGVAAAAVIPRYRNGKLDSLRAFVVLEDAGAPRDFDAAMALRGALGERLPPAMVPRHVHFVSALPLTAHGKTDRRRLSDLPMELEPAL
jgi:D-alanine--poly(phosphoribitol) ligase subunit 1